MAKRKKYYKVARPFTLRGKFYQVGKKIYLTLREKEILINKNLIK